MPSWFNDLMSSDQLRGLGRCPVCHTQNDLKEIKIIREKMPEILLFHHCLVCQSNILFCVMSEPWGVGSVGLITDLTVDEIDLYLSGSKEGLNENILLGYYRTMSKNPRVLVDKI